LREKNLLLHLDQFCKKFEVYLQLWSANSDFPSKLINSISYINNSEGKRIRPFIVCETANLFDVNFKNSIAAAVSIEMLHTYSLIHDDLPSMDDDDYRRGKKTLHNKYDEAIAILTGDSLLTESFSLLARNYGKKNPKMCVNLILHLAKSSGGAGLVGGQILDLYPKSKTLKNMSKMQFMKTGELISCSSVFGAILGNASKQDYNNMTFFGDKIGRAFQITDDLLDLSGDLKVLGKKTKKDKEQGKLTLVDFKGVDKAKIIAQDYIQEAIESLLKYGKKAKTLIYLSNYIITRSR
jgi:farnesyl diphosphate synthase